MRISDWSSDVCSSDLTGLEPTTQILEICILPLNYPLENNKSVTQGLWHMHKNNFYFNMLDIHIITKLTCTKELTDQSCAFPVLTQPPRIQQICWSLRNDSPDRKSVV